MPTTPTSLALTSIADNSQIIASTHRNNNSAIQTAVNALITFLSGGSSSQVVTSGGGTTINYAYPPGYEYAYNEYTAPVATAVTTEGTAATVATASAVTFDGATAVWIEFFAPEVYVNTANRSAVFALYDGATSIGILGDVTATVSATGGPVLLKRRMTPAAATKTYSVRAYVGGGAATLNVTADVGGITKWMPGYIRITKA